MGANLQAVKEFSKTRLRKRAQSNMLRGPGRRHSPAPFGFSSPALRQSSLGQNGGGPNNSLELIKEEIAIMKKLHHDNLVGLIEVLDDPEEDSLYMVMEYCKKGVVMKVGLDQLADPYDEESCRCWFRDMILGIEYRTSFFSYGLKNMGMDQLTSNREGLSTCARRGTS